MHVTMVGPASPPELAEYLPSVPDIPSGYGATSPVTELCRALIEAGHRVSLVTVDPAIERPWFGASSQLSVACVPYRSRARVRAADLFRAERRQLAEFVRQFEADVVHAHWTYEFALAALAVRPDALVTAHDAPVTVLRYHRDRYRAMRLAMACWARVRIRNLAVVSPYLDRRWRREMGWRGPTTLLPNIAPRLVAHGKACSRRYGPARLLVLASDDPGKNVRTLLRAWPTIRAALPGSDLRLAGSGLDATGGLADWARSGGMAGGVSFLGPLSRNAVGAELAEATMLVHPSLEESHGVALVEAMTAGVPVVAGVASGAVPWTLDNGRAGVLCDVTDEADLAAAVVALARDAVRMAHLASRARDWVDEQFSTGKVVAAHLDAYQRIVGDR